MAAAGLSTAGTTLHGQRVSPPDAPSQWVAFSADVRIKIPNRLEAWGRYVQDEHVCVRQDMVHPDGSALVWITNDQTKRSYRLYHGAWTFQPMRMGTVTRRPHATPVNRRTDPIDGFDAYVSINNVRSPRGNYQEEDAVIPALNDFRPGPLTPSGERWRRAGRAARRRAGGAGINRSGRQAGRDVHGHGDTHRRPVDETGGVRLYREMRSVFCGGSRPRVQWRVVFSKVGL
jgi:hypothetical protein